MQRMEAGVEREQLQQEADLNQEVNEEEVRTCWQSRNICSSELLEFLHVHAR